MLNAAAVILCLLAIAHSVLGERYIITRLLRRDEVPKLFGSNVFTKQTLRYCWHLTTVLGLGMALLLVQIENGQGTPAVVQTLAVTLLAASVLAIVVTRARHLSWVGFVMAGVICIRYAGMPTL
ncbi:hypothetical protein KY495_16260 [Massilia sp. PAMC28688]|uniref:hypothetical protein n=1 Tax=Massilia sp. PAMC28688 TaxID=2861283 RepID=UPI001C62C875|nr:hypothetical protein [Massilia sp. PAMC28688]QYF92302.1 hypothetical protein KY495_16260 [Massilia sp. PAMC28688]